MMTAFAGIDWEAIYPFIAIGFAAQLIDGALGMAFGVICNTFLVGMLGITPARASTKVHIVVTFTTAASALSHLANRNIDGRLFLRLVIPGVAGGAAGAYLLASLDAEVVRPFVLAYLVLVGLYLLRKGLQHYEPKALHARFASPLGLVGGFFDATGGGGWGPIVTGNLLVQGLEPRKVIGSANSAEFFVTVTVSATLLYNVGFAELGGPTLGLLFGGLLAAPFGAVVAKHLPPRPIFLIVGTVLTAISAWGIFATLTETTGIDWLY